jgi:P27 family predicted phage terminase small subunit
LVIVSTNGGAPMKHPGVSIINEASSVIKTLGSQLGLTPASRKRIATDGDGGGDDPWDGLLD